MVNTKNLSLKVLNRLKSVEVDLVRQVMPKRTFAQIEEGCRQRFELANNFTIDAANMAVQQLNDKIGRKAYVIVSEDNRTAVTVYHISLTDYYDAIYEKAMEKKELQRAKAEAKLIEREFLEKRRKERDAEKKRVEAKKREREAKKQEAEAKKAEREAKMQEAKARKRKKEAEKRVKEIFKEWKSAESVSVIGANRKLWDELDKDEELMLAAKELGFIKELPGDSDFKQLSLSPDEEKCMREHRAMTETVCKKFGIPLSKVLDKEEEEFDEREEEEINEP